jgi:putative transcriptional regulator
MGSNAGRPRAGKSLFCLALLTLLTTLVTARSNSTEPRPLVGQLLVASEEMTDARFAEAIIYIVKHDREGAMGLVINRPIAQGPIDDLLKGFGAEAQGSDTEIVVHYGGPVSGRRGFLLHSDDLVMESSIKAGEGIAVTSDGKIIQAIAGGKGPRQYLFMLGYAGWAPGQLEDELSDKSWFVISADNALIFDKDADKKWRRALDRRRIAL